MELLESILVIIFTIIFIVLLFLLPMEIFHKTGFSRWWGLLVPLTMFIAGFIGLVILALVEWPIHRELGWRRVAMGTFDEYDISLAQSYAIKLEKRGEWQQAIEVYETLVKKLPHGQKAEYAANSANRLREQLERSA